MKYQPGYTDFFINALTGEISDVSLIPLQTDYILVGDKDNKAQPSLMLKDLRLDFLKLKKNIAQSTPILQTAAKIFEDGQALDELTPGIMKQIDGIVATAIPDEDYATKETLERLRDETKGYRDEAKTSETNASNSASDAAGSARAASFSSVTASLAATEASASAAVATTAAATATTAAATASGFSVAAGVSAGIASTASEDARQYRDQAETFKNQSQGFATDSQGSATQSYNYLQQLLNTGFTFTGDVSGGGVLSSPIALTLQLPLNQIRSPTADIDIDDFKIINVKNPENAMDAVNLQTLQSYVGGVATSLTLVGDGTASGPLSGPITFTLTKTLNTIGNAGDINVNNFRLTSVDDPQDPKDVVNKQFLEAAILAATPPPPPAISLDSFVIGGPSDATGLIHTSRGPDCLLTNIPAGGDVDMGNYRIKNLQQSPVESYDAISAKFLWDLINGRVDVVWQQMTP